MKNQSGAIKTNLELYRVVQVVTGDSQEKVMIFRDKQTLHHNIYIIIIVVVIIVIINIIIIIIVTIIINIVEDCMTFRRSQLCSTISVDTIQERDE